LPALAADLVRRQVSVIVATGGALMAGIASSRTIPIVCSFRGDPVKAGFVESTNRRGKNVTGASVLTCLFRELRFAHIDGVARQGSVAR
jgi:ABC-type uncharacterized transport system substrate-binding protein